MRLALTVKGTTVEVVVTQEGARKRLEITTTTDRKQINA